MLKQAGVQTHPAMRIVIGVIIGALGLARGATAPVIIGGALVMWGIVAAVGSAGSGSTGDGGKRSSG